jgi:hypothetical protein
MPEELPEITTSTMSFLADPQTGAITLTVSDEALGQTRGGIVLTEREGAILARLMASVAMREVLGVEV